MSDTVPVAGPAEALGLTRAPGLVSIVGGGGKSSLMFALALALPGRTVMTTTTRIFAAQTGLAPAVCSLKESDWRARLDAFETSLLMVGGVEGDRAVGVPPGLPAELLAHPRVDWVLVESDGSRMLPVKAPAEHEPVIPEETTLLVVVAGIDALAGPIRDVAHRPERVAGIAALDPDEVLTPAALATVLTSTEGGLKGVPPGARAAVLVNKVESPADHEVARRVAEHVLASPRVERVAIGALRDAALEWHVHLR